MKREFLILIFTICFYSGFSQQTGIFIDQRDSNVYKIVRIGNQVWMAENLRYLPFVVEKYRFSEETPYCYVYNYNGTNVKDAKATANYITYGVLYNWYAAMAGSASSVANPSKVQGVCPSGWHLPSHSEWTQLTDFLGGEDVSGAKLKETDTTHWKNPNIGATNETGFTALPGGMLSNSEEFYLIGLVGQWWSSSDFKNNSAFMRMIIYNYNSINFHTYSKYDGCSVRCVRN